MLFLKLFILIILNVIIEFLPISSTAHSIIINKILNINLNINLVIALSQVGITSIVCYYFKDKIKDILTNLLSFNLKYISFCFKIIITMLPTLIFGLFFFTAIKTYFQSNIFIGFSLLFGSLIMYIAEKYNSINEKEEINSSIENDLLNISYIDAVKIGFLQSFSLIPGVSRSATTISACLLSKFSRKKSIEMSFFVSIPISFLGSFYDIYKNINSININNYLYYVFIVFLSFLFSIFFIKKIITFLQNNKLYIFIYYRVIFGILLILMSI